VTTAKAARNEAIIEAHDAGAGYGSLAKRYGVSRQRVKQIVTREKERRMPTVENVARYLDDFVAAERYLRVVTDARTNTPAQLPIPAGEMTDTEKWSTVAYLLLERGWRIAVDTEGQAWFFAPGPLTPPDDVTRQMN